MNGESLGKLESTNPNDLLVRVMHQEQVAVGGLHDYPFDPSTDAVVYKGSDATSFVDKKPAAGVRVYYAAFAWQKVSLPIN